MAARNYEILVSYCDKVAEEKLLVKKRLPAVELLKPKSAAPSF